MAGRFYLPRSTAFDSNGDPISGAKLEFFESGSSTPADTYSDDALTVANTNPVVADTAGRFGDIFLQDIDYKVVLKNASDVVIWTADPVRSQDQKSTEVRSVSTTTNLTTADDGKFIAADATSAAFVVNLPAASTAGNGFEVVVMKIDSSANAVTTDADGAETINGVADLDLPDQYSAASFRCDGTEWFAHPVTPTTETRILDPIYIDGFNLTNSSGDADHDVDVAVGTARGIDDNGNIILGTAITKQIDAAFAEGTNQGGLDTGTVAADTNYHIFAISKADGTADALFSLSETSPTLPSGFTIKRRIGQTRTDDSSNIIPSYFSEVKIWGEFFVSETEVSGDPTDVDLVRGLLSGFSEVGIHYRGIRLSGSSETLIQLYANDTAVTTGYLGSIGNIQGSAGTMSTSGFQIERDQLNTQTVTGIAFLRRVLESDNSWAYSANSGREGAANPSAAGGVVPLTDEFDGIKVTTINGTDTYNSTCVFRVEAKKYN